MVAKLTSTFIGLTLLASSAAFAGNAHILGKVGTTYEIVEPDFIEEAKEAAKQVDWEGKFQEASERFKKDYGTPKAGTWLPRAKNGSTWTFTPSYTLPYDIPDPQNLNRVLYPAGYEFNPLAYMTMPGRFVFVDAEDKDQMEWLKKEYPKRNEKTGDTIIITGGNSIKTSEKLGRMTYPANMELMATLKPKVVPTIYTQKGTAYQVREIYLPPKKQK